MKKSKVTKKAAEGLGSFNKADGSQEFEDGLPKGDSNVSLGDLADDDAGSSEEPEGQTTIDSENPKEEAEEDEEEARIDITVRTKKKRNPAMAKRLERMHKEHLDQIQGFCHTAHADYITRMDQSHKDHLDRFLRSCQDMHKKYVSRLDQIMSGDQALANPGLEVISEEQNYLDLTLESAPVKTSSASRTSISKFASQETPLAARLDGTASCTSMTESIAVNGVGSEGLGRKASKWVQNKFFQTGVGRSESGTLSRTISEYAPWWCCYSRKRRHTLTSRGRLIELMEKAKRHRDVVPEGCLQEFVLSPQFQIASALLILANGIHVGRQTEINLQEAFKEDPEENDYLPFEIAFCCGFTLELILRFLALGCTSFFKGPDKNWNIFDMVNVFSSISDVIMTSIGSSSVSVSFLKLARLVRLLRMLRMAREIHIVKTLAAMLHSLTVSFGSFGPALLLIIMTVYLFSVALLQGVTTYLLGDDADGTTRDHMKLYFSSSARACWTLLSCISGGYDWAGVADPLHKVGQLYVSLFLFFILFTSFCLLNILTAIFVNCAQQASVMNREIATDAAVSERAAFTNQLLRLFLEVDSNDDGKLTKDEFYALMEDDRNACFLGALGIDKVSVDRFFEIMDTDSSGSLDLAEFVDVCCSLKGGAKILHVRMLQDEVQTLQRSVEQLAFGLKKDGKANVKEKPLPAPRKSAALGF